LLVGQEKFLDHLKTYDKKELEKEIAHLKKDPRLKNTVVRIGHGHLWDDYKRLFTSPRNSQLDKQLGVMSLPMINLNAALSRSNHYNPLTDTVQIYGHLPEVVHHELGHARDFGDSPNRSWLLNLGNLIEQNTLGRFGINGGPFTQYLESNANREAEKGYKGDMKEFRRRLWPARGTYWSALAAGLAMLHPDVRETVSDYLYGSNTATDGSNTDTERMTAIKRMLRGTVLATGIGGVGALGGRLFAETRNLFDDGKKQTKKANMNTQQAYIEGFVKRANEYGYSAQKALELLKQAEPAAPVIGGTSASTGGTPAPAKPGFLQGIKNTFKKVLPGIPTSVGNTAAGYDDLAKRFQEQAGG
jgi:hypothetical protein